MTGTEPIIRCRGVQKRYAAVEALRGVDLEVAAGQMVALLGPNGAGKTTLLRILTTLTRSSAGEVRLFGFDALTQGLEIRRRIGVIPQDNNLDRLLTARENLVIQAQLHGMARSEYEPAIERYLLEASLTPRASDLPDTFSGGMQRRLVIARALLHDPPLLFLDEPTTGLDPQSRHYVWDLVARMKGQKTLVLTTHYMEEAERLADRVVIVDEGRVLMDGTPAGIKARVFPRAVFSVTFAEDPAPWRAALDAAFAGLAPEPPRWDGAAVTVEAAPEGLYEKVLGAVPPRAIVSMGYAVPTLEDVFIKLTGKAIREGT